MNSSGKSSWCWPTGFLRRKFDHFPLSISEFFAAADSLIVQFFTQTFLPAGKVETQVFILDYHLPVALFGVSGAVVHFGFFGVSKKKGARIFSWRPFLKAESKHLLIELQRIGYNQEEVVPLLGKFIIIRGIVYGFEYILRMD